MDKEEYVIPFKWDLLYKKHIDDYITISYRAKVFGGWIFRNFSKDSNEITETSTFIPDQYHQWKLE